MDKTPASQERERLEFAADLRLLALPARYYRFVGIYRNRAGLLATVPAGWHLLVGSSLS
jgi:hypothetical protein